MKYLLILLLALPVISQAQLEAGADYGPILYRLSNRVGSQGGYSYNYNTQNNNTFSETAGQGGSLTLSYRFYHKLIAGIGYDRYVLPLSNLVLSGNYYFAHPMNNFYGYAGIEYHSGKVSVTPQLLVGKSMVERCDYIYPGSTTDGSGLLVAFRISADYDVWHGICINVQGTGGTSRLTLNAQNNISYADRNINVALFGIAAGVHYRLQLHNKRSEQLKSKTLK